MRPDAGRVGSDGFAIHQEVLAADELAHLAAELSPLIADGRRAGARHLARLPAVAAIARDRRLHQLACELLGSGAVPYRATLFNKTGKANWLVVWHQDTALPLRRRFEAPGWGPWSVKLGIHYAHAPAWALERIVALRLHLDDSTDDNGPLRVIPGSHRHGVLDDAAIAATVRGAAAFTCRIAKGGVMLMRPLLLHASSKCLSPAPRRVLHIEYAATELLAPGIELARA